MFQCGSAAVLGNMFPSFHVTILDRLVINYYVIPLRQSSQPSYCHCSTLNSKELF